MQEPNSVLSLSDLLAQAIEHHRAGRFPQAEQLCRELLARDANHVDALHLMGVLAFRASRSDIAVDYFRKAIAGNEQVAQFHYNLGVALGALGRRTEARSALEEAVRLAPAQANFQAALGRCLLLEGFVPAAMTALQAALALDKHHAGALINLGVCHHQLGHLDAAENCFRRSLESRPGNAHAWNNLAAIAIERGEPEKAIPLYERAYTIDPAYAEAYDNRLMAEQFRVDVTPERLRQISDAWDERFGAQANPIPLRRIPPGSPLHIGFVSPDLYRTPVGYFLIGLLEALERADARCFLYSDSATSDDLTRRLAAAGIWRDMRGKGHDALAEAIRTDGIDILFDLAGHTKGNRLQSFARRLAPIQITWAGYAGTTGVASMDFILADRLQIPQDAEPFYRETVLRLPHDYVCYEPPSYAPATGPLPALRNGYVTFAGFHNPAKIGPLSLELWRRVLAAIPNARLILKYNNLDLPDTTRRIRRHFADAGIADERIVIEGRSTHGAMLARYNDVDIALDSLPYSGGLTSCEALWMGVPVVTLPGRTFAGRHSLTHCSALGLTDCIAGDADGYVRIAASLAEDLPGLADRRAALRRRMAASPLCDASGFAAEFLALMRGIVERSP